MTSYAIPRPSILSAPEPIGRFVADEFLAPRVPAERAAELIADVRELADLGAAGADGDVGDGVLA